MSDHESDNYDSEPDIFEIIVSDSEDDSDMEDLFSAPATGTQNTTMDEECQVEEGVSRRRTVEGHHVSEDNEDYLQRTYGVKSTQYCFRLGKKHIYCRNFIIEERSSGNVVINPTARFYKRASRKVKSDLESVPVHQFTPDEKEIRVDDADLYEMVESKEETVRGMHCVSTQACVGIKKHVKLYMPREVVEGSNFDMKVRDEGYAQVTRSTAVLDQFFSVYEFDDKMSEPDSTAGYIDAGRKIYKAVYDDVIAQHDLANFLGSSLTYHFRNERFVRVLAPETVKQYGTCFGRMLSLIMASKDFDLCERVDTSIANELSGAAWEQMINPLLEWIVSQTADSDTLCTMLVRPYLYNFKTKAWQSVAWCLKYIDALKSMFKMAMFLKSRDEFSSFCSQPQEYGCYFYLQTIYARLVQQRREVVEMEVSGIDKRTVFVREIKVTTDYISKLYHDGVKLYMSEYGSLCRVMGLESSIDRPYNDFVAHAKFDHQSYGLTMNMENNAYLKYDVARHASQKHAIVDLIDSMTRILYVLIFTASANTFRATELSEVNVAANEVLNRNLIYRHGAVEIVTSYGKNRKFTARERFYPLQLQKLIVNHSLSMKPLLLRAMTGIGEMDAIHVNFHRYQLFALSSNKLVERGHYYSTCRTIMKDFGGDIVRIREMRQAVSYFIKNAVVVDSKLDALESAVERAQGYTMQTSDESYAIENSWSCHFSSSNSQRMLKFFTEYHRFMRFDPIYSEVEYEKEEVASNSSNWRVLTTEYISQAKEICGYSFRDLDQETAITDVAFTPTRSRAILAHTGFGKTFVFLVPMIAYKIGGGGEHFVHLVLMPYRFLAEQMKTRLRRYLHVIDAYEHRSFSDGVDVIVGVFDCLRNREFVNFILNFQNLPCGRNSRLGMVVIDEAQVLNEEYKFRNFSNLRYECLKVFFKVVCLGATLGRDFCRMNSRTLLSPVMMNCVRELPNCNVYMDQRVGDSRELMYVKLKQYVKNFVNYYPDDLVLVYYDWKETLYAHEAELRRSYGDGVVTVTADIEDMEGVQDVVRTAKVVLATKSFSCGIDLPNIRAIVFFDTDVPVAEMIQVIGRARNKVSHMVELYSNRDPDEVRCFRQQMAAFYGIRAACNNCCGVVDAEHEDMLRKLWEDEPEETNQYDEIVVVAETEEEKNWYDEIVDEAESIMQQIEMGNPVIGSTFKYCKMAKYIQMFKSQPTFEHVDMCGYCYMPVAYCTRGRHGCRYQKTVKNVMMVRWILGDIDVEGIKEIIGGVEGVEQINWIRENEEYASAGIREYCQRMVSHSFINVDELPRGMPTTQSMFLMVVEQWKDRSVFGEGEEDQAVARKADGYFASNWRNEVEYMTFKMEDRCKWCGVGVGRHQCCGRFIKKLLYAIFVDERMRGYVGDMRIFEHWFEAVGVGEVFMRLVIRYYEVVTE
nr:DEAD box helicase [Candida albicans]WRK12696.1 DEAD box helicase [Candida albicans]WRK12697.1 DEAD box helicase [Candida albicans]WRK12698.1 DEAD box helicase [Candida albicans]WRK12699.1 DEAD box helicase [Candida albicans]